MHVQDPFDLDRFVQAQAPVFAQALQRFYGGERNPLTLRALGT